MDEIISKVRSSCSQIFSTVVAAVRKIILGPGQISLLAVRRSCETIKQDVFEEFGKHLEEAEQILETMPESAAAAEALTAQAMQEIIVLEAQAEQQLSEVMAQAPTIALPATGAPEPNVAASAASAYEETIKECMQEMAGVQERVLVNLEKEGALLQQSYQAERTKYRSQLERAKNAEDEEWRMSLDKRFPDSGASRRTEQEREADVLRLVQTYKAEHEKKAVAARKFAKEAKKTAQEAVAEAQCRAGVAAKARKKMEDLLQLEIQRRVEAQQSPEDASMARAQAQALASQMVAGGCVDLRKIQENVSGGAFVWVWGEDANRHAAHPVERRKFSSSTDHIVLYSRENWSRLEAHWLLLQAGGGDQYGSVSLDVGAKLFHSQTGTQYVVDLAASVQRNVSTNFARSVRRINSVEVSGTALKALVQQRKEAIVAVEDASKTAAAEFAKAALEECKATYLAQRAEVKSKGADVTKWDTQHPDGKPVGLEQIPMAWTDVGEKVYLEVELLGDSAEFKGVSACFRKSATTSTIVSVKRLQNSLLWPLYAHAREAVNEKKLNQGNPNEEFFWHGAKGPGVFDKISCSGFDTAFGRSNPLGIWLSTNSQYSGNYCGAASASGTRTMFLVRCTLGYMGTLNQIVNGERTDSHHCGGMSIGHVRRDDVTGGRDNRYVIDRNNQVYPAYVVEFK